MADGINCKKRIYRVEPPDELTKSKFFTPWQPERLTLRQGIQETAFPVLFGYILITIITIIYCISAIINLPDKVTLSTFFGYDSMTVSTPLFVAGVFGIQVYLIYRDLIRRSMAKTLFLIPFIFFLAESGILFRLTG